MSAHGRHRRPRGRRISRVSLLLTAGGAGVALPLVATGAASAATADTYEVQPGDTLSRIAAEHDIDGGWQALYAANEDAVGTDPGLIHPGDTLKLDGITVTAQAAPAPAEEAAAQPATGSYVAPVAGVHGSGYGAAGSLWASGHHTGADFPVGSGTPVAAITDGQVVTAGSGGSYGNQVVIQHADGHYSQYAHLSSLSVSVGQTVSTGQQIGLSGSTGNSTGPHLHFEVRTGPDYGSDIDPIAYLAQHGVTA
ncbi:LysM peptidoglycan-binding domain-containing M23 family metallopeptidase [Streptomyces avicenniae]|uniref:LysM peptidoglycan-binding domain-containing M23 family metallopeptidase n=1 Tax=Streptomyces avicenniae TaxID=500153 RepID=UPI00069BAEAE|nr:LysM peptidoglycan-binding domain-containing M23 family metallopeptidase [Streptomyces avicenniae]